MGDDALELKTIVVGYNNNVATDQSTEVTPANGACSDHAKSGANEVSHLLSVPQVSDNNREQHNVDGDAIDDESVSRIFTSECQRELQRIKRELSEVVVWNLKLWMVVLIIFLVIVLIIGISLIVCTVGHDDEDEKYDKSSFVVERFFRGNFTLDSNSFTSHPLNQLNETDKLLEQLKQQLTEVYNSSPALARFFSSVKINNFSDTTAQFELHFLMPSEHEQLVQYTLSREMVRNVLLQNFYDQSPDTGDSFYIIPTSLRMEG
ncbi:TPA-induced transmembrane protein isoform X1 [Myxocyprinus asiaticus]|uniref:TPA-induced transmembrane protein isoform X1 n=1 Tax=Myxocyprinus asiaticus TaxID=70543 RepID=UPI0022237FBE|nr:TPA-induced transmembrane protein isoform X1 [Myxocyprinus asiaticus]